MDMIDIKNTFISSKSRFKKINKHNIKIICSTNALDQL